ncbi:MAG: thioredoxin family protein [Oceanobacter sp.]
MKTLQTGLKGLLVMLIAAFLTIQLAQADELKEPYSDARFEELQKAGETVLIDVYATWCPTCAWQQSILSDYRKRNPDKRFYTLVVDYDNDKASVKKFRAPRQSTLLIYKHDQPLWFSVAETRAKIIYRQLDNAINLKLQN